jgi:lysophospholipase L1-like esterase
MLRYRSLARSTTAHMRKVALKLSVIVRSQSTGPVKSVLVFGDSNTWGYDPSSVIRNGKGLKRIDFAARWTTQLQALLGGRYRVIDEGLNGRTTVLHDPSSPADGAYSCEGRRDLNIALHSHKPLDAVVIALGTNDLKARFGLSPSDVAYNVRILASDVKKGPGSSADVNKHPSILLLGLPHLASTPTSSKWGFLEGTAERARHTTALIGAIARDAEIDFLDISKVATPSLLDGIHFDTAAQALIATAVSTKLHSMLGSSSSCC